MPEKISFMLRLLLCQLFLSKFSFSTSLSRRTFRFAEINENYSSPDENFPKFLSRKFLFPFLLYIWRCKPTRDFCCLLNWKNFTDALKNLLIQWRKPFETIFELRRFSGRHLISTGVKVHKKSRFNSPLRLRLSSTRACCCFSLVEDLLKRVFSREKGLIVGTCWNVTARCSFTTGFGWEEVYDLLKLLLLMIYSKQRSQSIIKCSRN